MKKIGGRDRDRTGDPLLAKPILFLHSRIHMNTFLLQDQASGLEAKNTQQVPALVA